MRYFLVFLITVGWLAFSACTSKKDTVKIGLLFNNADSPRWDIERGFFEERVGQLGGETFYAIADRDAIEQYNQALDVIAKGVDVIVIAAVNGNTAAAIIRKAHESGVKVIAYDGMFYNSDLDYLVGFDLEKAGEMQAQFVTSMKPSGTYVVLNGDKIHSAAEDVRRGCFKVIQPLIESSKINLIYEGWIENWSGINAKNISKKIVEYSGKKIDAIIVANDGIAKGVGEVLAEKKISDDILITGMDGTIAACNRILNGRQTMTVYKPNKLIGYAAAELAYKVAKNEKMDGLVYLFNGRVEVPSLIL